MSTRDGMAVGLRVLRHLGGMPLIRDNDRARRGLTRLVGAGAQLGSRPLGGGRPFPLRAGAGEPVRLAPRAEGGGFDLTPTADQEAILDVVRGFAAENIAPSARAAEADGRIPEPVHRLAHELGLHLLGVPEAVGGLTAHAGAVTTALITEELAAADLGCAVTLLAPGAVAGAIAAHGNPAQQATYLPALTGQDESAEPAYAVLAVTEQGPLAAPLRPATTATRHGDFLQVSGTKVLLPVPRAVSLWVISVLLEGQVRLVLLEAGDAGIRIEDDPAMGLRAAHPSRLRLDGVRVPADRLLGEPSAALDAVRRARLAWCAAALGVGRRVLESTREYVVTRHAFGAPIAHRQSVAFTVADMAIEIDALRLVVWRAAARLDDGEDAAAQIAAARTLTARHLTRIGSDGVQMFGGHGFTTEFEVERWYRDLQATALMEGVLGL